MSNERFASVWDAIEDTPEEAENMKLRSALMMALKKHIETAALSQSQAAKVFGVTQPRVSDLMHGKISLFGLDALVNMAAAAGMHVENDLGGALTTLGRKIGLTNEDFTAFDKVRDKTPAEPMRFE